MFIIALSGCKALVRLKLHIAVKTLAQYRIRLLSQFYRSTSAFWSFSRSFVNDEVYHQKSGQPIESYIIAKISSEEILSLSDLRFSRCNRPFPQSPDTGFTELLRAFSRILAISSLLTMEGRHCWMNLLRP